MKTTFLAATSLAALFPQFAAAQTPGFHLVGVAPGGTDSRVQALSADGRVAAGTSFLPLASPGFTWTAEAGRNDFGFEADLPGQTGVRGISGDGSTVVGQAGNNTSVRRAFRYRGPGTIQDLGILPGYTESMASSTSGDGSIVAGYSVTPQSFSGQAFRWTAQSGMQPLGFARPGHDQSEVRAVSRDGSTLVGNSGGSGFATEAAVWRQGAGVVALPSVPSALSTVALGTNIDGSVIVGHADAPEGGRPLLWRNGLLTNLGLADGWSEGAVPTSVNDVGTVVVGSVMMNFQQTAVIWTQPMGWETLTDYLVRYGVPQPSGWTLTRATCMSADGLTIGGSARDPAQQNAQGFVVTIPSPGGMGIIAAVGIVTYRRRR